MNGAQWLVHALQNRGVENVFVLHGNGMFPFLDAFVEADMRVVDVRNEQAASYMADAWGAMTGRPGIVAVSAGPGHTNAITGLANASWDGRPMLLISGSSPQRTEGADTFQELDQVSLAKPVCKYAARVRSVESLPQQLHTALSMAVQGRPGPVHLTIPNDVFTAEVDASAGGFGEIGLLEAHPCGTGDHALVRQAAEWLARAERPFMLAGSGAFYAHAWDALKAFAQRTDIPILSHIWDRGCIEEAIPQYVGVTRGGHAVNAALPRLAEADVVLTVGARIDYRVGQGRPPAFPAGAKIIRIDADPVEVHRNVVADIALVGDPGAILRQIVAEVQSSTSPSHRVWLDEVRASRQSLLDRWAERGYEETIPLPAIRVCREIRPFLDRQVTFLVDGGNIGQWAHLALFDRHPSHWLTCGASGVVGWGLSGAIAAKLARPNYPLLLLSGDGSAGFNVAEIETALRFQAPYVAVIACDGAWGIVAEGQPEGRRVASQLPGTRFDHVAQALGARGVYIEAASQLRPAIEEGLAADTVTVIQVPVQLAGPDTWERHYGAGAGT